MKIRGINIHFELFSSKENKPVIVLIHGFLSSSFSFRRLIPLLEKDFTVLAIDLPPFGKSDKSKQFIYSYQNLAAVVIELIQTLQFSKVILVGHSMGGQISLYISKQKPELVDKVILLGSSGYLKRMNKSLIFSSYLPFFHIVVKQRLAKQGVLQNLYNVVHDHSLIDQDMIDGYTEPFLDNKIFMALTKMIRDREGDLSSEELKKIEIPTLLIWGEHDRVVPVNIGKRLEKDLPNSRFISLEKTGHLVPEERPLQVHDQLLTFIQG